MKTEVESIGSGFQNTKDTNSRAIGDVIAMQMASITYCSLNGSNSVKNTLKQYLPSWQLVWEPVQAIQGDWAFIAYNGVQYVIGLNKTLIYLHRFLGRIPMILAIILRFRKVQANLLPI